MSILAAIKQRVRPPRYWWVAGAIWILWFILLYYFLIYLHWPHYQ